METKKHSSLEGVNRKKRIDKRWKRLWKLKGGKKEPCIKDFGGNLTNNNRSYFNVFVPIAITAFKKAETSSYVAKWTRPYLLIYHLQEEATPSYYEGSWESWVSEEFLGFVAVGRVCASHNHRMYIPQESRHIQQNLNTKLGS